VLIEQTESAGARTLLAACGAACSKPILSHSLAEFPKAFPQIYRAMIEAASTRGGSATCWNGLPTTPRIGNPARPVIIPFIYPVLLTVVAFLVIAFLVAYSCRSDARIRQSRQTLPCHRVLIAISDFARAAAALARRLVLPSCWKVFAARQNSAAAGTLAACGCRSWEAHPRVNAGALRRHAGYPYRERFRCSRRCQSRPVLKTCRCAPRWTSGAPRPRRRPRPALGARSSSRRSSFT